MFYYSKLWTQLKSHWLIPPALRRFPCVPPVKSMSAHREAPEEILKVLKKLLWPQEHPLAFLDTAALSSLISSVWGIYPITTNIARDEAHSLRLYQLRYKVKATTLTTSFWSLYWKISGALPEIWHYLSCNALLEWTGWIKWGSQSPQSWEIHFTHN